jgi:hypothetical protein
MGEGISEEDPYFRRLSDDMEAEFVEVCRRCIPPDAVCFDIGANIGVTTLVVSEIASDGRVYSFEPSPTVYPILVSNITKNGCRNVKPMKMVSDGSVLFRDNGAVGFGFNDPALSRYVSDKIVVRLQDGRKKIRIVLVEARQHVATFPAIFRHWKHFVRLAHGASLHFRGPTRLNFLIGSFDNFEFVAKVDRMSQDEPVKPLTREDLVKFLYANMLAEGCVSDLVVAAVTPKFWPLSARVLLQNFHTLNDADACVARAYPFLHDPGSAIGVTPFQLTATGFPTARRLNLTFGPMFGGLLGLAMRCAAEDWLPGGP